MSSIASVQRTPAAVDKSPDFRARAMAKQAWLVRRSEPRRGLLFGLIAGTAIGCLSAVAVLSVVPNDGSGRAKTVATQPAAPATETNGAQVAGETTSPNKVEIRQTSTNAPAAAPSATPATPPAAPAAVTAPATPRGVARTDVARTDVSANAKVSPVTPAEPPATQSLTSDAPILAQGGAPESKPIVTERKKKKKPQVVRHRTRERAPAQFAPRDNFFFGGDRMARTF